LVKETVSRIAEPSLLIQQFGCPFSEVPFIQTVQVPQQFNVFFACVEFKYGCFLGVDPDAGFDLGQVFSNIQVTVMSAASCKGKQSAQHPDGGGLPSSAGSE
jgi:hypothetical protein